MNPKDKEFKALQTKWYEKLKKKGFEDIETDEDNLKVWHSFFFTDRRENRYTKGSWDSKEEYYRLAGQFLHEHEFIDATDRFIWEHHAAGKNNREILDLLKSRRTKVRNVRHVDSRVRDLAEEMVKKCLSKKQS